MEISLANLFGISVVAFLVPYVMGFFPRFRVPAAVMEVVAGVIVGPSVLGWIHPDPAVRVMATIGVAFLLFLSGMDLDMRVLKGAPLVLGSIGFVISLGIALAIEIAFHQAGLVLRPLLVAIALSATSAGIVIPALRDAGQLHTKVGTFVLASSSIAEFATVALLAVFFAGPQGSPFAEAALLVGIGLLAVGLLAFLAWFSRNAATFRVVEGLKDTSSQLRLRLAFLILLGAAVVAGSFGFEAILGTFMAGAVLGIVIRDWKDEENYRKKLEAVGYGFFVPVFFVASGLDFTVSQLFGSWFEVGRLVVIVLVMLLARGVPALLYRRHLTGREMGAAAFLQATNLSFMVIVVAVGERLGAITSSGGEALYAAGLLSAVFFPPIAQSLLRKPTAEG